MRRPALIATAATLIGIGALALLWRQGLAELPSPATASGERESELSGREPSVDPPALRVSPVLELLDERARDVRPALRSSVVAFDDDFMWLTARAALLRVARDGGATRRVETEGMIVQGTLNVIGARVVWVEYELTELRARVVAASRTLDEAPVLLGELDDWFVGPVMSRVIAVDDDLAFLALATPDVAAHEQPPEYVLARVPARGGALHVVALDSMFCNDYGDITSSRGRLAIACIQQDPASRVFDVDARTSALRLYSESSRVEGWRPSSAVWTGETMIVTSFDFHSLTVKRLFPDGQMQTIVDEPSDTQVVGQLVGDGVEAYLYCHGGVCGRGRMLWLADRAWAELPDPPLDALRVGYSGGVVHWEQWSERGVVLYANTPWPRGLLRAEPDADYRVGTLLRISE
ncbi:MAG: hypothetical protein R3A51_01370 [Nannocystaceae bacterium]